MQMARKSVKNQKDGASPERAELLAMLAEKERQLAVKDQQLSATRQALDNKNHIIREQQKRIALIEEYLRLARVQRFGSRSEKLSFQVDLFDEAELDVALSDLEEQLPEDDDTVRKTRPKKRKRGFSDELLRIQVHLALTDEEKEGATNTFFTKIKEELDIVPAQARVLEYWQEKAVFERDGEQQFKAAARPVHPLGKCMASTSLLAHIVASKYADALPLYRLETILQRYGGSVNRTAMANWIIRLDDVFKPLINLMREHQLAGDYLQADETRLQVLKETGKVATSDKWMWVIRGGPPAQPVVLFEYDASRSEEVPLRLLEGFEGVLQTDGYAGYNKVCRDNPITRIGCMDHARRKFVEASKAAPTKQSRRKGSVRKADVAIGMIRKLYRIESRIKGLEPEQKREHRQRLSVPLLNELKAWLEKNVSRVPKDSLTRTAIQYMLNQWDLLVGYCEDGRLHISNALAENAIRPLAVGRRNWLFSDTPRGARASATCFSLVETAKANGLEPYAYLNHILADIGSADTLDKLEALLPWNIKLTAD
jgi:transposase